MRTLIYKLRAWITRQLDDLADFVDPDYEEDEEITYTTLEELAQQMQIDLDKEMDRWLFAEEICKQIKREAEDELGI